MDIANNTVLKRPLNVDQDTPRLPYWSMANKVMTALKTTDLSFCCQSAASNESM